MSDISTRDGPLWSRLLPAHPPTISQRLIVGFWCVAAGYCARLLAVNWISGLPFLTFFPMIVVASIWGGPMAAAIVVIGAAVLAVLGMTTSDEVPGLIVAVAMFVLSGAMMAALIHALQSALIRIKVSEEQAEVLAREMRHRVANVLQLVQSIAQLTLRTSSDPALVMPVFESRLMALAKSHRISSGGAGNAPSDLRTLLTDLLAAYGSERIDLFGPPMELKDEVALRLGLIFHELATNAAKHGALSVPEGRVAIAWQTSDLTTEITWSEKGGPPVARPSRQGFGSKLIPAALTPEMGKTEVTYALEGVQAYFRLAS